MGHHYSIILIGFNLHAWQFLSLPFCEITVTAVPLFGLGRGQFSVIFITTINCFLSTKINIDQTNIPTTGQFGFVSQK